MRGDIVTKIIGIVMNKGGVGKTTIATHLSTVLSIHKKVLIIDADAQGNASLALGVNPNALEKTIYDCMLKEMSTEDVIINIGPNLDLLPSNKRMNFFEMDVVREMEGNPFEYIKCMISSLKRSYDYIIIDSPPSLGLVTGNVLKAVDSVFIPFVPEKFSVQGMIHIIEMIKDAGDVSIEGVIATMVDRRTKVHRDLITQARTFCKNNDIKMLETLVPRKIGFTRSVIDPHDETFQKISEEAELCHQKVCLST
jgi:chromosome partitioning protein